MQKREGTLRRELSFIEAIALSIGIMAPTAAMALNGSLAAGITGSAVPLAFLLAAIAVALASFSFIQFSRYFAHSGSVYGFNGVALGPRAGFFSGWALLGTYLAFTGASTAEIGNFAQAFFASVNVNIDWLPLALVAGVLIWGFAYSAIALSTRLTLVMEGVSVLLILIVTVVILSKVGAAGQLTAQPFNPGNQPLSSVGLAAVFGFLSFAGFEGAATLGEETRNPRRNIPLAILAAVITAQHPAPSCSRKNFDSPLDSILKCKVYLCVWRPRWRSKRCESVKSPPRQASTCRRCDITNGAGC